MKPVVKLENGAVKDKILTIQDSYIEDAKDFVAFLNSESMEFTLDGVLAYVDHLQKRLKEGSLKAASFNKRVAGTKKRIRQVFQLTKDSLDVNKVLRLEALLNSIKPVKIASHQIEEDRVLSTDEIKQLMSECTEKVGLFVEFLAVTGCRVSEMVNIPVSAIKESEKVATIPVIGKGQKMREVIISPDLLSRIKAHFKGEEWLFATSTGHRYTRRYITAEIKRFGQKTAQKTGIEKFNAISAHTLRHSFATNKIRETGKLKAVSRYLGHHSTSMTMDLYDHSSLAWDEVTTL